MKILRDSEINKEELFKIIPELKVLESSPVNHPAHRYNILEHSLEAMKLTENPILKIVLLLHDIGKPEHTHVDETGITRFWGHPKKSAELSEPILKRLRFDDDEISLMLILIEYHDTPINTVEKMNDFVAQHGIDTLGLLLEVQTADMATHAEWYAEIKMSQLKPIKKMYEMIRRGGTE